MHINTRPLKIAGFIIVMELAGAIGSIFTAPKIGSWYATLEKPFFSPPNFLFGPVWTILYALMGVALYFVWEKRNELNIKRALTAFNIQLALNILWSFIFFGMENPFLAFIEIIILWAAILWTTLEFKNISKASAWLLLPYIIWVSFAAVLNVAIWRIN